MYAGRMTVMSDTNSTAELWAEWAKTATTDIVPDFYRTETLPDGTVADRAWWFHPDSSLRDVPPS